MVSRSRFSIALRVLPLVIASLAVPSSSPSQGIPPNPDLKRISPFFDGWAKNPDGTYVLSFGYFSRNTEDVEIQVGPTNSVSPPPENRNQPTNFIPGRQQHVFHITVPADSKESFT